MDTVTERQSLEQPPMPPQDVITPSTRELIADLGNWTSGPLPSQPLEQIALMLFTQRYTISDWANPVMHEERHRCRMLALRLRVEFLKVDQPASAETDVPDWTIPRGVEGVDPQWLDAWFAAQLANVLSLHIWGKPLKQMARAVRADVKSYAESVVEDAVKLYAVILDPTRFVRETGPDTDFDGRTEAEKDGVN